MKILPALQTLMTSHRIFAINKEIYRWFQVTATETYVKCITLIENKQKRKCLIFVSSKKKNRRIGAI